MNINDNVGKCGHARCAGGNGCYEKGKPMRAYKKIVTLADQIEALGDASDYKGQAALFLKETGADISIREAVPQKSPAWSKDVKHGIHYSVTISKDVNHSYTFDYWGSIADKENNFRGFAKRPSAYDILCCLHDDGIDTYGDFCANYGYDEDSRKAYSTYEAVQDQKENMQRIFSADELFALSFIR